MSDKIANLITSWDTDEEFSSDEEDAVTQLASFILLPAGYVFCTVSILLHLMLAPSQLPKKDVIGWYNQCKGGVDSFYQMARLYSTRSVFRRRLLSV